ncbi:MAG: MBL fold metallo-hydrolase [Sandaracinaceae bacterium]|nr:MBL fold metallo-hydrolase [Sandaracinaceae bacterium]
MRVTILGSGSAGNCTLVETKTTRVLIDAGLSAKQVRLRMKAMGRDVGKIDGVVITHAHGDHSAHAQSYAQAFCTNVYMTESTRRNVRFHAEAALRVYGANSAFEVGDLAIEPHAVPHDAPQVALRMRDEHCCVGLATDLGEVEASLVDHLKACDVLMIESNYDDDMLTRGPYPEHIQRRVRGRLGHLDNLHTAELLRELTARTHTVVLMHLSKKNNTEEVARAVAQDALSTKDIDLYLAQQDSPMSVPLSRTLTLNYGLDASERNSTCSI